MKRRREQEKVPEPGIGVLMVSQGELAREMVRGVEAVAGRQEALAAICVKPQEQPEEIEKRIRRCVEKLDRGRGVLVLTDMFGNTPTNVSLSLAAQLHIEVLAGCNMPMLIKVLSSRRDAPLRHVARFVRDYGAEHIFWATERPASATPRPARGR